VKRISDLFIRTLLVLSGLVLFAAVVLRFVVWPTVPGQIDIAHGGGAIGGLRYTNSIAAIEKSAAAGFRVIEIDIETTSDGHFVCGHDWDAYGGTAPDFATFIANRDAVEYPSCTLGELIAWFERNPQVTLYADIKTDVIGAAAVLATGLDGRLIVDAAAPEMVCALREAGVRRIVYSTYLRPRSYAALVDDLSHPCLTSAEATAIPLARTLLGHALLARVRGPVLVHTVTDCWSSRIARFLGADALISEMEQPDLC